MNIKNIICLDDLIRNEFDKAKEFFYNLIREPIFQATGLDIGSSPKFNEYNNNLKKDFNLEYFLSLLDTNSWVKNYNGINSEASVYLIKHIKNNSLIISYEMPNWLKKLLSENNITFIDIRISPLRFARDLYITLNSNETLIQKKLLKYRVLEEELYLEASLAIAFSRHKKDIVIENNSIIIIGQTNNDASLIDENGNFVRIEQIDSNMLNSNNIYYLAHPLSQSHKEDELNQLKRINNNIKVINENIYDILATNKKIKFISISSSVLQEAKYFHKEVEYIFKPICVIDNLCTFQIRFSDLIKPIFWHKLLKVKREKPKLKELPPIQKDWLRTLHNVWWGYASFTKEFCYIDKEAFKYSGGEKLDLFLNQVKDKTF